jgi:hypothetical protein
MRTAEVSIIPEESIADTQRLPEGGSTVPGDEETSVTDEQGFSMGLSY